MGTQGEKMIEDANKTIEDANKILEYLYKEYLKIPKATVGNHNGTIYEKNWCVWTGRSCVSPHPHRHYTFEEFIDKLETDDDFTKYFTKI
jgi:hypothetical protein